MVSNQKFESSRFKTKGDITGVVLLTAVDHFGPESVKRCDEFTTVVAGKKNGAGTKPLKSIDHVCASVGV